MGNPYYSENPWGAAIGGLTQGFLTGTEVFGRQKERKAKEELLRQMMAEKEAQRAQEDSYKKSWQDYIVGGNLGILQDVPAPLLSSLPNMNPKDAYDVYGNLMAEQRKANAPPKPETQSQIMGRVLKKYLAGEPMSPQEMALLEKYQGQTKQSMERYHELYNASLKASGKPTVTFHEFWDTNKGKFFPFLNNMDEGGAPAGSGSKDSGGLDWGRVKDFFGFGDDGSAEGAEDVVTVGGKSYAVGDRIAKPDGVYEYVGNDEWEKVDK